MADYINDLVRIGAQTSVSTTDCVLVDFHGGNERPLAETLTNLEVDRDRYKRDLDELSRRHREEHAVVQKFIDRVIGLLMADDALVIEDWDDFDKEFGDFDGFDVDRPRREWSADVKLTVSVSVSGEADINLDVDDIESLISDSISFGDVRVGVSFSYDNCETDDSAVEDYDVDSVDVAING